MTSNGNLYVYHSCSNKEQKSFWWNRNSILYCSIKFISYSGCDWLVTVVCICSSSTSSCCHHTLWSHKKAFHYSYSYTVHVNLFINSNESWYCVYDHLKKLWKWLLYTDRQTRKSNSLFMVFETSNHHGMK